MQNYKTLKFINEMKSKFPKIDFSQCNYINSKTPVKLYCTEKDSNGNEHGWFEQKPEYMKHYNRCCDKCRAKENSSKFIDTEEFIRRSKNIHKNIDGTPKYIYTKTIYKSMKDKLIITCPIHGDFEQISCNHLSGSGCPKCSKKISTIKRSLTTEEFIKRSEELHKNPDGTPKYNYSKSNYITQYDKVIIICPEHGEFEQTPCNHMNGQGCPKCVKRTQKMTTNEYIQRVKELHPNKKYIFDKTNYTGHDDKLIVTCPIHGDFEIHACNFINKSRNSDCPKCSQERLSILQTSKGEREILEFIKSIYSGKILTNTKDILDNKQELDIYIPDKKIAIEFDGIYFHSEIKKDNNYHLNKTILCEQNDIQLIHIFETEWYEKQNIIKSRIQQLFGLTKYRIPARKCIIKPISNETEKKFFNNNHLQGYINSTICYGLFYTEKSNNKEYLVACMSFGPLRKNLGQTNKSKCYELYRFANLKNFTVIGGASKLFKYFINKFKPNEIISYADRRYSSQLRKTLYENLGFKFVSNTQPSYFYIVNNKLINRFNFRKDILVSKYGCPPEKTEHQFCLEQGWYRIYDCGNLKYVWLASNLSEITK